MPARPARRSRAALLLVLLAMPVTVRLAPLAPSVAAHPARRALTDEAATAAAAADMLTRLNAARAANGLQPYRSSPLLAAVAAAHAREIAEHNHYSHTGLDGRSAKQRMADAGYGAGQGGVRTSENFVARSTVDEGFQWLMDDPGHRPNMLDPTFREVGVGAAPTRFGFVWVLDFGTYDGVADVPDPTASPTSTPTSPPTLSPTSPPTVPAATVTAAATATDVVTATIAPMSSPIAVTPPTRNPRPTAEPRMPTAGLSATSVGSVVLALLVVVGLLAWASTRPGATRRR